MLQIVKYCNENRVLRPMRFLLIIFLLFILPSFLYSQTEVLPAPINSIKVRPIDTGLGSLIEKDNVGRGNESEFTVTAVTEEVGVLANNEFHWIVYGGTIVSVTGGDIEGIIGTYVYDGNQVSEVFTKGCTDGESTIKIKWQDSDFGRGFIAVRQISEYGCSDDIYSIYYVDIKNTFVSLNVVAEANSCAQASDNYISYSLTISNYCLDKGWKFKYKLRTKHSGEEWKEWIPGNYGTLDTERGYVVIPDGIKNSEYLLNIPISDTLVKGSGDYIVEIKITDVRDSKNSTVLTLPTNDLSVFLHKIPLTDFVITTDD